jgi:hypothetical protein
MPSHRAPMTLPLLLLLLLLLLAAMACFAGKRRSCC